MKINSYQMSFNGQVLERGFWLYIWKIEFGKKLYLYVGRTGDSSSANASSPFNRIGQHLDFRKNAKGNSLAKRLLEANINPKICEFTMLALGPLFKEQPTFEEHKPFRDRMAILESEIAKFLKECGYIVLGIHHGGKTIPGIELDEVKRKVYDFVTKPST